MMKVKLLLVFSVFIFSTIAYAQTSDVTEGCAPAVVQFTAPAGSATWFWDFKDGATSNLQNPTNTFTTPGTYAVEFKLTPAGAIVGTITIKIYPKPNPLLTASTPTKGCVPLNVSMAVTTTLPGGISLSTYNWTYGDGSGGSSTPVSHIYSTPGVYSVSVELTTNSPSCNLTKIFPNYISCSAKPLTGFATNPNPPSSCTVPLTVAFGNTTTSLLPLTYNWNMGNGNTSTNLTPPPQNYTTSGNFTVVLTATDTNNCSASVQQNVTIGQPHASFTIPDTVCFGDTIKTITNLSSAGFSFWNIGSNGSYVSPDNFSTFQPNIYFTAAGLQAVKLTIIAGSCVDDTTLFVYVEKPVVIATAAPIYSCSEPLIVLYTGSSASNVTNWNWDFGSTLQNASYTQNLSVDSADIELLPQTITQTLTITTAHGCKASDTATIRIHLPWARFIPDVTNGCAPLTVTFYDSTRSGEPITNWLWNYDDGTPNNSLSNGNPHTHTFTSPGEYDVTLIITNSLGCKDTSYKVRIEVGGPKVLDFSVDKTSICPGETVHFTNLTTDTTGIDAWNYSSSQELLSHCFTDDGPSLIFNNKVGPQSITLTAEYNGCYSTVTKPNLITVKGPIADFNYLKDCNTPYDIQLTDLSGDATSLSWDFGDGTTSALAGTFTHTYLASGDYNIVLTAVNNTSGCAASTDTALVHIRKIKAKFVSDSLLCGGANYGYDASASIDVNAACFRGYTWFFSDHSIRPITLDVATAQIPLSASGAQTVGLVVEDINGCKDTLIKNVGVYNLNPNYTVSNQTICLPDTLSFTDMSNSDTTVTSWNWTFGDGTSNSSLTNPIHIYNAPLGMSVSATLLITNILGCTDTTHKTINIYSPSSIISSIPNICLGQSVIFNASDFTSQGSNLSFNWNFGDGTSATGNTINHTYPSSGSKPVTMIFTEIATGCKDSTTAIVNIQDYPVANFYTDVDSLLALCDPQQVNFFNTSTSTSPVTNLWNWGAGTGTSSGLSLVFPKGTDTVSLIVSTSYGCADTVSKILKIVGPKGDFNMDVNNICKGQQIIFTIKDTLDVATYAWDFGDGSSIADISPANHIYNFLPPSGQTVAKLTVYGQDNVCPVTIQKDVFIHYVKADFTRNNNSADTTLCLGESLLLTNTSSPATGNIYSWTLGDGATQNSSTSFIHNYATAGNFNITLMAQNATYGCKDTTTKVITIAPLPIIKAVGDTVCKFSQAQLSIVNYNASNGYIYSWSPALPLSNANIYNPTLNGVNSEYYTATVVDTNSCSNKDSAYLFVIQPLTSFTFDTTIVIGDFVYLPIDNQNGTVLFSWSPEDGLSCLDCSNPKVQPLTDITYTLTARDIFSCSMATDYFNIHVRPETFIELPTTFTPNGDGTNDIIYVKGWGIKELKSFEIYNRWGELVYKSSDLAEGWNGFYKGILQNNDTYVYKVRATNWREKEISKEGHINLMR